MKIPSYCMCIIRRIKMIRKTYRIQTFVAFYSCNCAFQLILIKMNAQFVQIEKNQLIQLKKIEF